MACAKSCGTHAPTSVPKAVARAACQVLQGPPSTASATTIRAERTLLAPDWPQSSGVRDEVFSVTRGTTSSSLRPMVGLPETKTRFGLTSSSGRVNLPEVPSASAAAKSPACLPPGEWARAGADSPATLPPQGGAGWTPGAGDATVRSPP
jgi:hypothetical protein